VYSLAFLQLFDFDEFYELCDEIFAIQMAC